MGSILKIKAFGLAFFMALFFIFSCGKDEPTCADGIQNGAETGIDCGGECNLCLSSETDILSIKFQDSPGNFGPIIKIDNTSKTVYIAIGKVFPTSDISNLDFDIEVSDGATVLNMPVDYNTPKIITIKAANGTVVDYKIVITGAYGTYSIDNGNGTSESGETRAIYQKIITNEGNGGVQISLAADENIVTNFFYYDFTIGIGNSSFSNSLVGEYNLIAGNSNGNYGHYTFPKGSGGLTTLLTPYSGKLVITKHDLNNKLISGRVLGLAFTGPIGMSSKKYYTYAEFINVRYR